MIELLPPDTLIIRPPSLGLLAAKFAACHRSSEKIRKGGAWGYGYGTAEEPQHPIIRDTSRRVIGYLGAYETVKAPPYLQISEAGIKYLIDEQQADGQWIWWYDKKARTGDSSSLYVTSIPVVALLRWRDVHGLDDRGGKALDRALGYLCSQPNCDNANYNFFAVWALATAAGRMGGHQYLDRAVNFALHSMKLQLRYGCWWDRHNQRIWYHGIILRGLAALLNVLPENHTNRWAIQDATLGAVNHLRGRQTRGGGYTNLPDDETEVFSSLPLSALAAVSELEREMKLGWDVSDSISLSFSGINPADQQRGATLMALGETLRVWR